MLNGAFFLKEHRLIKQRQWPQIFTEYYHKPYIVLETFKYIIFFKPHNPMSQEKLIFSCLQMRVEPGFELRFLDIKAQCRWALYGLYMLHASNLLDSVLPL